MGALPPVETDNTHDLVNICHDPLNHDRGLRCLRLFKELCEGGLSAFLFFDWRNRPLSIHNVPRQVEQLFEEVHTVEQPLLMAVLEIFESFSQGFEPWIMDMLPQAPDDLDLDLLCLLGGVWRTEDGFQ